MYRTNERLFGIVDVYSYAEPKVKEDAARSQEATAALQAKLHEIWQGEGNRPIWSLFVQAGQVLIEDAIQRGNQADVALFKQQYDNAKAMAESLGSVQPFPVDRKA